MDAPGIQISLKWPSFGSMPDTMLNIYATTAAEAQAMLAELGELNVCGLTAATLVAFREKGPSEAPPPPEDRIPRAPKPAPQEYTSATPPGPALATPANLRQMESRRQRVPDRDERDRDRETTRDNWGDSEHSSAPRDPFDSTLCPDHGEPMAVSRYGGEYCPRKMDPRDGKGYCQWTVSKFGKLQKRAPRAAVAGERE